LLADFSILKMEAIRSSETSVHTRTTRRHIPEDRTIHSHPCDHVASHLGKSILHLGKSILKVIDGTGFASYPVAGFDVSSTDPSMTATRELITYIY
jgi:hypothetical protein